MVISDDCTGFQPRAMEYRLDYQQQQVKIRTEMSDEKNK
ncbi:MAG: hypothetical protein PWP74_379 [Shewanella sp.]|jgi:hypothetical protein|uniref:Uncharacterized protein n=1 Tax=Shewanella fodinae TaxID=552357 RepID=A0A4R2F845_9GAMM|nr:hypothetical protein [Shewanella sp.]TCN83326.1 hypothetical protein EDC91_11532 [Shewanella fodinae]